MVRNVDDPHRSPILGGSQRQLTRARFTLLPDADDKVDAATLAKRDKPVVLGALLDPHLDYKVLHHRAEPRDIEARQKRHLRQIDLGAVEAHLALDLALLTGGAIGEDHRFVVPPIDQAVERHEVEIPGRQTCGAKKRPVPFRVLVLAAAR